MSLLKKKEPEVKDTKRLIGYLEVNHGFSYWFRYISGINWVSNRVTVKTTLDKREPVIANEINNALLIWAKDKSLEDKQITRIVVLDNEAGEMIKQRL